MGGRIVTFYSYKGGTGRSMALANVAWVLASQGAKVLVVDWDLEAPGLHRYFRPFLADKELSRIESQGVIDLMFDFVGRLVTPGNPDEVRSTDWYRPHADVTKWSKRLLWPSGEDARTNAGGTIDFIPAGRQSDLYARRVNSFDWGGFYEKFNGGAFVDAMRQSMASEYDWVLIDSRTGLSDTSGICTVQLPDILVVCFTLNYQSISGASSVAASARASKKGGDLRVIPVPMRLDGNEEKPLKAMMAYAKHAFGPLIDRSIDLDEYWRKIGVPYFSRYAYLEKLSTFEEQVNESTSTLPSMERLTTYIRDKDTKLQDLPEPHRSEVSAEFDRLPGAEQPVVAAEERSTRDRLGRAVLQAFARGVYRLVESRARAFAPTVLVLLASFFVWNTLRAPQAPADGAAAPPPSLAPTAADVSRQIALAFEKRQAGNVVGAIADLSEGLRVPVDRGLTRQMYRDRAFCYKVAEDWPRSIEDLTSALAIDQALGNEFRVGLVKDRAFAYIRIRDLDLALADYQRLVELEPNGSATFARDVLVRTLTPRGPASTLPVFVFTSVGSRPDENDPGKLPRPVQLLIPKFTTFLNVSFWPYPVMETDLRYTDAEDAAVATSMAEALRSRGLAVGQPAPMSKLTQRSRRIEIWFPRQAVILVPQVRTSSTPRG